MTRTNQRWLSRLHVPHLGHLVALRGALVYLSLAWSCPGMTEFSIESRVLGNGRIEYRLEYEYGPDWEQMDTFKFYPAFSVPTDPVEPPPEGWIITNQVDGTALFLQPGVAPTPSQATFHVESDQPGIQTNRTYFLFSGVPANWNRSGLMSSNVVGYMRFDVLIPGPYAVQPGMNDTLFHEHILMPDVKITHLSRDELVFDWPVSITAAIQTSSDFLTWTTVDTILGGDGTTTWNPPLPLPYYGKTFRVEVLEFHAESSSAATASMSLSPATVGVAVFPTEPGTVYETRVNTGDTSPLSLPPISFTACGTSAVVRIFGLEPHEEPNIDLVPVKP